MSKSRTPKFAIRMTGLVACGIDSLQGHTFEDYIVTMCKVNEMPLRNASLVRQSTGEVVATYRAPSFVVD